MKNPKFKTGILVLFILTSALSACSPNAAIPRTTPTLLPTETANIPLQTPTNYPIETSPIPEVTIPEGDLALSFGDYESALKFYRSSSMSSIEAVRAAGIYGEALALIKMESVNEASQILQNLITAYPDSLPAQRAHFLLGQIANQQEEYATAIAEWQTYLSLRPGFLDAYVYELIGDAHTALGQQSEALKAYTSAYLFPSLGENFSVGQKIANLYEALGQPERAIEIYQDLSFKTTNPYLNAQFDLLTGRTLVNVGKLDEGYQFFQHAVENFPETYDAYSALVALVDAGQPVNELQRGLINYYIGQYDLSIAAFDRFIESDRSDGKDKALYYKALATRSLGTAKTSLDSEERFEWNKQGGTTEDNQAIALWKELVSTYPQSEFVVHAIEDVVYTLDTYMDNTDAAIETAQFYVAEQPLAAYAPSLLFTAGRYYEIQGELAQAAATWDTIAKDYPASDWSFHGALFAGIIHFRLEDYEKAASSFNRALLLAIEPLEVASASLWLGKVFEAKGDSEKAEGYWNSASLSDPSGYYGLRSQELLDNQQPFSPLSPPPLDVDLSKERIAAESWLRTSFNLPPQLNLEYSSTLFEDPAFLRAHEYHKFGLFTEARTEWESLRSTNLSDPVNTFRLMKVFLDLGYYQSAIQTSKTVLKLAGYSQSQGGSGYPRYFDYVQYGVYYLDWIKNASERFDVPILLILSVIYQESNFNGLAYSSAGAQGLMQLMPATARQIAAEINYPPNYTDDDLTNPFFNLTLGTNYLARQLFVFSGDIYAALAAYNAGPGNALEWKEIAGDDPDLFLGSIRYLESRNYVRKIAEIYAQYVRIYGNNPQ